MNLSDPKYILCARIFQGMAVAGFLLGCYFWVRAWSFYSSSIVTTGLVTSLVEQPHDDRPATYAPTVKFMASNGSVQTFTNTWGTSPNEIRPGASVPVRYRPRLPADASIDNFMSLWGLPVLVQGICIFDFFLAVALLYYLRKGAKAAAG
ncbi:MAG TPA: DUF3592 domain-containing protein [Chthoniobacter sp.]|jgi:hypothetical protein